VSYQAQRFVRNIRGVSRGEKALLMALSFYHDYRNGSCLASNAELARDTEMSERHIITLLQHLESRNVVQRHRDRDGRGSVTSFELIGMRKSEPASSFTDWKRVKSATQKDEIHSEKDELVSPPNKERKIKRSKSEETHPNPPSQGGNTSLTVRDRRRLNAEVDVLMLDHLDGYGHQRYENGKPVAAMQFADAVETACARLFLPIQEAWEVVRAAGLGDARRPVRATG
jgi:Helix-turn-helix domain